MRAFPVCVLLLALGTCAGPRPKPVAAVAPPAPGTYGEAYGTILVARRAAPAPGVLAAVGEVPEAADPGVEFIVREDDGQVISVVEPDRNGLAPGERVRIVHGTKTSLAAATKE